MPVDVAIGSVFAGIAANSLTALIRDVAQKARDKITGEALLQKWATDPTALRPRIREAAQAVADSLQWDTLPEPERVSLFLTSPELQAIIEDLLITRLTAEDKGTPPPTEAPFVALLSAYTGLSASNLRDTASSLFKLLIRSCDSTLSAAIDTGVLSAHEAKSSYRYKCLTSELQSIQQTLSLLSARRSVDASAALLFLHRYTQQVHERHAFIVPPDLDRARKFHIDEIYVVPHLRRMTDKPHDFQLLHSGAACTIDGFFTTLRRTVVLGNPGAGKSTLAQKLAYQLSATDQNGRRPASPPPALVVVREYAAVKREKDLSIVQFIDSQASSRYQVPTTPETIEYLLLSGNLSVIFDGLDEVLDPQSRREVACDIESFCNLFRQVPVLITSRTVGYDQAPLDARRFDVLAIEDFDTGRVTEYARKWFTVYGDLATSEVGDVVDNFMTESIVARDIRSNPLMLALICNLYRGEHYIPRNLAELYEKCSLMLFDRWDRFRGTRPSLPFEHHVFPTMNYLAQWMYWGGGGGTAVSEGRLVDAAVEYLYPTRFLDRDEARSAATQFIAFCKGRAWVFSEVGCKESGEGIYQFTHRTFLEYFAACYLVRTYVTSKDLAKRLLVDIKDGNLQVVAQLAIQMHGRNFDSGADQLMMEFMRDSRSADGKRKWDSLLFLARLLGVLIPSAKVTRGITERILQTSIEEGTDTVPGPSYLIEALLHSAEENLSTIRKVADVTLKRLESRDPKYVPRVDIVREWISKGTTGDAIGR